MVKCFLEQKVLKLGLILCLCISVSACTTPHTERFAYTAPEEISDPLETVNRAVFGFNNVVDIIVLEPVAKVYHVIIPRPVRNSIQNFMRNLRTPLYIANNTLQGDFKGAGTGLARFAINSTIGIGGLFDIAKKQGLEFEKEDFGQTLALWGVNNGFYIVLPILGPSSLRDASGLAVDIYADPVRLYASNTDEDWIYYTRNIIEGVDTRERLLETVSDLRENSLDYYAAVRSIYAQRRSSLIQDNVSNSHYYIIPDYDEEDDY